MALGRLRRPEALRHVPPSEIGKVIGLDRVSEVLTLRKKIAVMAKNGTPTEWMKELSRTWMETDPREAGYLYIEHNVLRAEMTMNNPTLLLSYLKSILTTKCAKHAKWISCLRQIRQRRKEW